MKALALNAIKLYQLTRVFRGPACRFYPSCSSYLYEAVARHGLLKGLMLGALRLLRCHPYCEGGVDEVPATLPQWKLL